MFVWNYYSGRGAGGGSVESDLNHYSTITMLILSHWEKKKSKPNKNQLGKKPGGTNFHENATKSSFTALRRFCRKVLLLVKVPLVWEAEPGGVVGETIVWFFPPTPPPNQFKCLNELESPRIKTYLL